MDEAWGAGMIEKSARMVLGAAALVMGAGWPALSQDLRHTSMIGPDSVLKVGDQTFTPTNDQIACARQADANGHNLQVYIDCMRAHGHLQYGSGEPFVPNPTPSAPTPPSLMNDGTNRMDKAIAGYKESPGRGSPKTLFPDPSVTSVSTVQVLLLQGIRLRMLRGSSSTTATRMNQEALIQNLMEV
jgi:hypothetical protein